MCGKGIAQNRDYRFGAHSKREMIDIGPVPFSAPMIILYSSGSRRQRLIPRHALLAISCSLALMCFGCRDTVGTKTKDVTYDPAYGNFSAVVGTWRTKSQLTLMEIDDVLYLSTTGEHTKYRSYRDLAVLPVGTEVRIEHLIFKTTIETETVYATGTLTSGPHAGKAIQLDDELFVPNFFKPPTGTSRPSRPLEKKWIVAADRLE
jgi:hypothetical protein